MKISARRRIFVATVPFLAIASSFIGSQSPASAGSNGCGYAHNHQYYAGSTLIASLANLRASDEAMGANDNDFSFALASGLRCVAERLAPNQLDWVGYMTEGFRRIFKRWALDSNVPIGHCSEELVKLLQPLETERNRHKARKLLID